MLAWDKGFFEEIGKSPLIVFKVALRFNLLISVYSDKKIPLHDVLFFAIVILRIKELVLWVLPEMIDKITHGLLTFEGHTGIGRRLCSPVMHALELLTNFVSRACADWKGQNLAAVLHINNKLPEGLIESCLLSKYTFLHLVDGFWLFHKKFN